MKKLNILVTNNHLETYGGSETFTYAFIEELVKKGHNVEYFTFEKGLTSNKIENNLGVYFLSKYKYDVVFANHNSCVELVRRKLHYSNIIIQTCHGIYPELEQPSSYANYHVSISKEVEEHLKNKNTTPSSLILNGINVTRFSSQKNISKKLTSLLSLCQSKEANSQLKSACEILNINFKKLNKFEKPIWDVEKVINESDLVVGLGRSAYEAMSCGRPVLIFDNRPYSQSYSDGYLNSEIIEASISHNCSGRYFKKDFSVADIVYELKKYDAKTGLEHRNYVLEHLNIEKQVEKYMLVYKTTRKAKNIKQLRLQFSQKTQLNWRKYYKENLEDTYLINKYYRRKNKIKNWLNIK
jgi:hypothetical protein